MITKQQLQIIENWVYANARPIEVAKWNLMLGKGSEAALVAELVKYQNPDGGFGHGLESDLTTPDSSAICSCEAIMNAQDFGLDLRADWVKRLLAWFENTVTDIPSFWEEVPPSTNDYPRAPWWGYPPNPDFSPNPCAVAASALLTGTQSQRALGGRVAGRCAEYILRDTRFGDHDTYCLQRLFVTLAKQESSLVTPELTGAMDRRILKSVCTDQSKWTGYVPQPLDLIDSPDSRWYPLLKDEIPGNIEYWEHALTPDACWPKNWDYGFDSEFTRTATKNWVGYIAVKRVKIMRAFGAVEM